eukprot:8634739-Pyramimonas_sp.AAC.1
MAQSGAPLKSIGCLLKKKGDWAWLKELFNLQNWRGGAGYNMCFICGATQGAPHPFTDCSFAASWRTTLKTHHSFMRSLFASGKSICPLWNAPGFALESLALDLMHVADLGIVQILLGNVLFEMFKRQGGVVSRPGDGLAKLLTMIRIGSRNVPWLDGPPINNLTLGMIKPDGKAPSLRTKAADTRHMVAVVHWILQHLEPPANGYERLRFDCLDQLHKFYLELADWSVESASAAIEFGRNHVQLYCELARVNLEGGAWQHLGWHAYKIKPKHHLFIHLLEIEIP